MKRLLVAGVLSVGLIHAAHAQLLDIGGIELRLGQRTDEALRSLSPYQVQYSSGSWVVSQKVGNLYQFLGVIGATANVISFISKVFPIDKNEQASEVYTSASKELRRRGGRTCATREVEVDYTEHV